MGILSGLASMFGWGTADFLAAKASRKIGNVLTLLFMQVVGFFVASLYFLLSPAKLNISAFSEHLIVLLIVAILQTGAYLAFYQGLSSAKVSLVSPIGASWGLVTAVLSVVFFKEILSFNQTLAVALIVLGLILLSLDIKELIKIRKITVLGGVKEGLVAMFGWGISMFLIVGPSQELGWFLPVYIFRLFAIVLLILYVFWSKTDFKEKVRIEHLKLLLPVGLLDIFAFFSYSFGVQGESASIVAPVAAAFPLITIVLVRIFLKEELSLSQGLGIVGTALGLVLISF